MFFYALQFCFEKSYLTFAQEPDKFFWARLKEKTFAFVGKWLEHLGNRGTLCVHRPKIFIFSNGPGYETLMEWIPFLNAKLIDRLFLATSQSIKERRDQILRLDNSRLAVVRFPIVQ